MEIKKGGYTMGANFTPDFGPVSGSKPFKFWCQKVIPLVYDDSLSYYELLCKVVNYINNLITDVATTESNIELLRTAYSELENYVNNYFNNLDVQNEINNKLDAMADNGTLDKIINERIFGELNGAIATVDQKVDSVDARVTVTNKSIDDINKRIDNVVKFYPLKLNRNGEAIVIVWGTGNTKKVMLVDGGWNTNSAKPFYSNVIPDPYPTLQNDAEYVYNWLTSHGFNHIDYQVVTHWHEDHIGGMGYCFEGNLYDANTVFYFPAEVNWGLIGSDSQTAWCESMELNAIARVGQLGATVVRGAENLSLTDGDVTINFFNSSDVCYAAYYGQGSGYTTANYYNNFSMCMEILFHEQRVYILGDIEKLAEDYLQNRQFFKKATFSFTPHHGYNTNGNTNVLRTISPRFWIIQNGLNNKDKVHERFHFTRFSQLNVPFYYTGDTGTMGLTCGYNDVLMDEAYKPCEFNGMMEFAGLSFTSNKTFGVGATNISWDSLTLDNCFDEPIAELATLDGVQYLRILKEGTYMITAGIRATPESGNSNFVGHIALGYRSTVTNLNPLCGNNVATFGQNAYPTCSRMMNIKADRYFRLAITCSLQGCTIEAGGASGNYNYLRFYRIDPKC